ncbi:HNH endonuclease [Streptomyces sp. NPDC047981]|uniref:HNH endonuclease n=1 Tax=Streptomyces sp. NPDC047981 TaxID=3154610 RepID=UPI0034483AD5
MAKTNDGLLGVFLFDVDRSAGPDDCWPWIGHRTAKGYGQFQIGGRKKRAHRWLVEWALGDVLEADIFVCHTCDNPPCCNPSHLFIGDAEANNRDKAAKGRHPGGFHGNQNQAKTHCRRGHEFTAENTRIDRRGYRECRACERIRHGRADDSTRTT